MSYAKAVLLPVLCVLSVTGQETDEQVMREIEADQKRYEAERKTFRLLHNCDKVAFLIFFSDDSNMKGLSKDRLKTVVESRLRGARLFREIFPAVNPLLSVSVFANESWYGVDLNFQKLLFDPHSEITQPIKTWETRTTEKNNGNAEDVVGTLSRLLDEFIVEYLRVNEGSVRGEGVNDDERGT